MPYNIKFQIFTPQNIILKLFSVKISQNSPKKSTGTHASTQLNFAFLKKTGVFFLTLIKRDDKDELWFTDGPVQQTYDEGMKMLFGDDVHMAVTAYWKQVREMISTQKPDVVAHLDKIKMHNKNRFFTEDEAWYEEQVDETLGLIAEAGTIVEVNTRGIYKGRSEELFPGVQALKKIHRLGIPITLSSDAHRPEELSGYFREALEILDGIGFKKLMLFSEKGWTETPVKS